MTIETRLKDLRVRALADLKTVSDVGSSQEWERTYLGGKGELTSILRGLGALPAEERPAAGRAANALKAELADAFAAR